MRAHSIAVASVAMAAASDAEFRFRTEVVSEAAASTAVSTASIADTAATVGHSTASIADTAVTAVDTEEAMAVVTEVVVGISIHCSEL